MSAGPAWYVVHTQPNGEVKAEGHLRRQGFRVYLPRYLRRRSHARRIEIVPTPLFPRYLFVALDLAAQRWRAIRSTFGVADLVMNGEQPAAVPGGVVESIKSREDTRGFIVDGLSAPLRPGQPVRIVAGALADCLGLFQARTDEHRVTILLELLGQSVRAVVPSDSIVAA